MNYCFYRNIILQSYNKCIEIYRFYFKLILSLLNYGKRDEEKGTLHKPYKFWLAVKMAEIEVCRSSWVADQKLLRTQRLNGQFLHYGRSKCLLFFRQILRSSVEMRIWLLVILRKWLSKRFGLRRSFFVFLTGCPISQKWVLVSRWDLGCWSWWRSSRGPESIRRKIIFRSSKDIKFLLF